MEKYFLDKGGLLPRLDSHLGSLLMTVVGMRFQAYAESCQSAVRAPRGRSLLCMIAQHFRLDLNRGSDLTQQALFDLQLDNFIVRDLEKFVERIEYVLNAIPQSHQPSETTNSLGCILGSRNLGCCNVTLIASEEIPVRLHIVGHGIG